MKKSYPLIDFLNFSESCYRYIFKDMKVPNKSSKFIDYSICLINQYSKKLKLTKKQVKLIINEFLKKEFFHPSSEFRKLIKNKMRL